MRLVIPIPPSKNAAIAPRAIVKKSDAKALARALNRWARGNGGAFREAMSLIQTVKARTPEYDLFETQMLSALQGQKVEPLEGDVRMSVTVFFPDRRRDMANVVDVLLDALEGVAYGNDRQVVEFGRWSREIDADDPRCVVTVESLNLDLFAPDPTTDAAPGDTRLHEKF